MSVLRVTVYTLHRPLLDAINTNRSRRDEQTQHYTLSAIAVEGVIRPKGASS